MNIHVCQVPSGLGLAMMSFLLSVGLGLLCDQLAKSYLLARGKAKKPTAQADALANLFSASIAPDARNAPGCRRS